MHAYCDAEGERLESELSMIRYIAWAIPSIGFLGTVRGIGDALNQAHQAIEGDIFGVTRSLGVAFNSTLIALLGQPAADVRPAPAAAAAGSGSSWTPRTTARKSSPSGCTQTERGSSSRVTGSRETPRFLPDASTLTLDLGKAYLMNLLGLELCDAGILVAGGEPPGCSGSTKTDQKARGSPCRKKEPGHRPSRRTPGAAAPPADHEPFLGTALHRSAGACAARGREPGGSRLRPHGAHLGTGAAFRKLSGDRGPGFLPARPAGAVGGDGSGAGHPAAGLRQPARGGGGRRARRPAPACGHSPASLGGVRPQGQRPPGVQGGLFGQRKGPGGAL
ncbi:MAG: MotA/TolQ/ExbB proton channel family protein [Desulfobacterales bacterium]|nr:MotA/TolQ/ExbB proton channel family protein [Desulfobacterales bacterium]